MKKFIIAFALLASSAYASADEFVAGAGFANISDGDISVNALYISGGYKFGIAQGFSVVPEVRLGWGVGDDTYYGVNVSLDSLYGVDVRAQWDGDQAYFFAAPSYTHSRVKGGGLSASSSDFGGGIGVGYKFNQQISGEVSYESITGTNIVSVGVRFHFPQKHM